MTTSPTRLRAKKANKKAATGSSDAKKTSKKAATGSSDAKSTSKKAANRSSDAKRTSKKVANRGSDAKRTSKKVANRGSDAKKTSKKAAAGSSAKKTSGKKTATSLDGRRQPALLSPREARATYKKLIEAHPDAHCELDHESPFQLVVATALSAQSTDVQVNRVTPELFKKFPTPEKLARADQSEVEACVNRLGMFRQKSKNLIGLAKKLVEEHGGEVPADQDQLVALPGVGRKTANVVLGVAFQAPVGVVVDTHVQRITQRLGFTQNTTPEKIERDLMELLPRSEWDRVSHTLIFHGRRICSARKPSCSTCPVNRSCVSAFDAEEVGRKPKKNRS